MKHSIYLYCRFLQMSIRSQLQFRLGFILLLISDFINTFIDISVVWLLFERFKVIEGWSLAEVSLLYGIVHMSLAIAECAARGFDTFSHFLKTGDFDRLLLRPLSTLFQVISREFYLFRLGRFFQGFLVLLWGSMQLNLHFLSEKGLILLLALLGTTALFYALFIFQAAFSFWMTETLELMNITTYGGAETGQYPIFIYKPGLRYIFTFVVPIALVSYYPIEAILGEGVLPFSTALLYPLAGLIFFYLSTLFWTFSVRHYRSTGC